MSENQRFSLKTVEKSVNHGKEPEKYRAPYELFIINNCWFVALVGFRTGTKYSARCLRGQATVVVAPDGKPAR